ncbi:MAG: flagellar hook-associated protein FlgK [Planctomycetes bacterium GWF2_42_9]|nr:MAG: flagellar hook-associated protein FlgK [Planctomycetes bacterium GWF2_42_9]HAL45279.1 flagellar hook-associated protein FlgK [Phycisphaerales bacterium]
MGSFNIALSGLGAVQTAFDIIGSNITNAGTEGYHKQIVQLAPSYTSSTNAGGVKVINISRIVDTLLEQQIYQQNAALAQLTQENNTLSSIETAIGELSADGSGINAAIDSLFTSMQELKLSPTDSISMTQLVSNAEALTSQFRNIGEYLTTLEETIAKQTEIAVGTINSITAQIGKLNNQIESVELVGGNANTLRDQRDQYISDLSQVIGVQTIVRGNGVTDIVAGDIPLVVGSSVSTLATGVDSNGKIGIMIKGGISINTSVNGGSLGGLITLANDKVVEIHDNLDNLASSIINQINKYHVQGIGSSGSFTELTGWANSSGNLSEIPNVSAGFTYIRVTNTSTGESTRTAIPVLQDTSSDTLAEIADYITNNVSNISAYVNSSNQLTIAANSGYEFDFIPEIDSSPATTTIASTDPPQIKLSGYYNGTENNTWTFTATAGQVGTDNVTITVRDNDSNVVATLDLSDYPATTDTSSANTKWLEIGDTGISIAISANTFNAGDSFTVNVYGNTDTSGLLSAVGINTFFSGDSAINMAVCSDISNDHSRVAASLSSSGNEGGNIARLYNLQNASIEELGNLNFSDYYRQIVTDVGQDVSSGKTYQENLEAIVLNLTNQQTSISGVDINEEAAHLMIYEQMFQSMAKYMEVLNSSITELMNIL